MKVPICFLCHKRFDFAREGKDGGEWLKFADYQPIESLDMPPGVEWFCKEHAPTAASLSHLVSEEALIELEHRFGKFPKPEYAPVKMTWRLGLKFWWNQLRPS